MLVTARAASPPARFRFYAFYEGHPFRIRYMMPLVAACALFCGLAVGLAAAGSRRSSLAALRSSRDARHHADPVAAVEARRADAARGAVGSCRQRRPPRRHAPAWRRGTAGEKILASMGSLAHYMQELSREGFAHRATSFTKATARSGSWRSRPGRRRTRAGCSSRSSRKAATCSRSGFAAIRTSRDGMHGSAKAAALPCTNA